MDIDLKSLSDEDFQKLAQDVYAEQSRRATLANAPAQVAELNRQVLEAQGIVDGDEWRQPTGAFDAYPEGAIVAHDDKTYASLTPANVWEPPTNWREQAEAPAEWIQPTNAEDAYSQGDQVTFEGEVYESLINANTWSPTAYPAGWKKI